MTAPTLCIDCEQPIDLTAGAGWRRTSVDAGWRCLECYERAFLPTDDDFDRSVDLPGGDDYRDER